MYRLFKKSATYPEWWPFQKDNQIEDLFSKFPRQAKVLAVPFLYVTHVASSVGTEYSIPSDIEKIINDKLINMLRNSDFERLRVIYKAIGSWGVAVSPEDITQQMEKWGKEYSNQLDKLANFPEELIKEMLSPKVGQIMGALGFDAEKFKIDLGTYGNNEISGEVY